MLEPLGCPNLWRSRMLAPPRRGLYLSSPDSLLCRASSMLLGHFIDVTGAKISGDAQKGIHRALGIVCDHYQNNAPSCRAREFGLDWSRHRSR